MMRISLFIFSVLMISGVINAQEVNQFDDNGKRHGVWKKYFPNSDQLRYEGRFDHGKEIGTFKFYCEDCKDQPMVVKEFTGKDQVASAKFYTIKGKLVSEGMMNGKKRTGEWLFYHKKSNTVMSREFYVDDKLDGKKTTYYTNGTITEEIEYENGIMQGVSRYYAPDGVLLKDLKYFNDELHGEATYYDAFGNVTIKGSYKHGAKHGLWRYYKGDEVVLEETYPKPKPDKKID